MKVVNHTRWRTDHLRAFLARVAEVELEPERRRRFIMEVKYNRGGTRDDSCSGRAAYFSRRITVMVPSGTVDRTDLAQVIAHEIAHTRGMKHPAMRGSERYRRVGAWRTLYAWAETLPLEPTPAKPPVSLDVKRAEKLETARARLAQWEKKAKRAETYRKKWARRVRRMELAATHPALVEETPL